MPTSSCLKGWHNVYLVCIYANEGQWVRRAPKGASFVIAYEEPQQAGSATTSTTTASTTATTTTTTTKHEVISLSQNLLLPGATADKRYLRRGSRGPLLEVGLRYDAAATVRVVTFTPPPLRPPLAQSAIQSQAPIPITYSKLASISPRPDSPRLAHLSSTSLLPNGWGHENLPALT